MITQDHARGARALGLAERATALYLDTLSPRCRLRARPAATYATAVAGACDRFGPAEPSVWIRRAVREAVLADLVAPDDPLENPLVVGYATELARELLERLASGRSARHGNAVVEPDAAPGFAAEALIAWGRAETARPGSTDSVWAYVRTVARNLVARDLDAATRQLDPGERAARREAARLLRERHAERTGRVGADATQAARARARDGLLARGVFVERTHDAAAVERVPAGSSPEGEVEVRLLLERIRGLVAGPGYTEVDRETWVRFELAGMVGRDIRWLDHGVMPHTGAQRLLALLRKLARDLADWHRACA